MEYDKISKRKGSGIDARLIRLRLSKKTSPLKNFFDSLILQLFKKRVDIRQKTH
jgi:hypothetical protein